MANDRHKIQLFVKENCQQTCVPNKGGPRKSPTPAPFGEKWPIYAKNQRPREGNYTEAKSDLISAHLETTNR